VSQNLLSLQSDLDAGIKELKATVQDSGAERTQLHSRIKALEEELHLSQREMRSLRPIAQPPLDIIHFSDDRLKIYLSEGSVIPTEPKSGKYDGKSVVFEKILHRSWDRLPRIVSLYRQMGEIALVQKFYSIAEHDGTKFALMEDMSQYTSLAAAIPNLKLSTLTHLQKLRVAYELAATISALHESGVVIKVISDHSIYLEEQSNGDIRPKIADLKNARAVSHS